ncbi:CapA family protein [Georgenia subflava]|uniref:CapA family protein n=1 Tax=Georgenia subflava TaxID=1622177 RepID=A0A6N7EPJ2_9MICO|nr:CapA family protein [Georgenia subflava]MPV39038.1 CapA family protein [Georgenia subflava]
MATQSPRHGRKTPRRSPVAPVAALAGVAMVAAVGVGLAVGTQPLAGVGAAPVPQSPVPTTQATTAEPEAPPTPVPDVTFTILSAGDVLPHATVNLNAEQADGTYDYLPLLAGVQDWVAGADLALCNLEVPVAPPGEAVSAYPVFGAPEGLVSSLAALGWDGCATATNHSMDRGLDGVFHTLDVLDAAGLGHVGTARSPLEAEQPQMYTLEREGREIVVAQLAATTIDNGLPAPASSPWAVTKVDVDALVAQARAAREAGADIVVANVHWGLEYVHSPVDEQLEIGAALAESGEIDLVFGNHSHVPQPIEKLPGGPDGDGMWLVWSMGNFISNQDSKCCTMETATGLLVTATVTAPAEGPARVTDLEWTASTVDRVGDQHIYPLHDLVAGDRPEWLTLDPATIQQRAARVQEVMGAEQHRVEPPQPTGPAPQVLPRER